MFFPPHMWILGSKFYVCVFTWDQGFTRLEVEGFTWVWRRQVDGGEESTTVEYA